MGSLLKKQKKYGIFSLALGLLLIFNLIPISSTFASTDESNSNIIKPDKIIYLSEDEYQNLLESFDDVTISTTNISNSITIFAGPSKPGKERTDWGNLVARSTYVRTTSSGTRQYTNSGNSTSAQIEFENIGTGEITQYVSGSNTTFVKRTPSGDVRLYLSSSKTEGAQRPSLSFLNDKIRFLGN